MKFTKTLLTGLAALLALAALTGAVTFATALFLRGLAAAWRAGWTLLLLALLGCSMFDVRCSMFPARATPVLFSSLSPGGALSNRRILVTADQIPYPPISGTNNLTGLQFYLQPVNGMVITNLVPWGYTYQPDGWPRSVHIVVTNDTATHNVTDFINPNPFTPITLLTGGVTIFATVGAGTNTSIRTVSGTNFVDIPPNV